MAASLAEVPEGDVRPARFTFTIRRAVWTTHRRPSTRRRSPDIEWIDAAVLPDRQGRKLGGGASIVARTSALVFPQSMNIANRWRTLRVDLFGNRARAPRADVFLEDYLLRRSLLKR